MPHQLFILCIIIIINYNNYVVGFSFGGTLALSVTASLWKSPLISTSILEKNLCCITLSSPLIIIPTLKQASIESPKITSILHSFFSQDDFIPRLAMFLDPNNGELFSECIHNFEDFHPLHSIEVSIAIYIANYELLILNYASCYLLQATLRLLLLTGSNFSDIAILFTFRVLILGFQPKNTLTANTVYPRSDAALISSRPRTVAPLTAFLSCITAALE